MHRYGKTDLPVGFIFTKAISGILALFIINPPPIPSAITKSDKPNIG